MIRSAERDTMIHALSDVHQTSGAAMTTNVAVTALEGSPSNSPAPVVAVEVFVEQDAVAPVRILLKLLGAAVHGPVIAPIAQEDPRPVS
jgi:hypothetical protein